jgi:hypothetical protein
VRNSIYLRVGVDGQVCTCGYGARKVGARSTRGSEGLVGRSPAGTTVGMAEAVAMKTEETKLRAPICL